jgi:hypothetical protein
MIISEYIKEDWTISFESELSKAIIPLSDFFNKSLNPDIYTGEENLPFNKMDCEYRNILLKEFLE